MSETKRTLTWQEIDDLAGTKSSNGFRQLADYFLGKNKELYADPDMDDNEYWLKSGTKQTLGSVKGIVKNVIGQSVAYDLLIVEDALWNTLVECQVLHIDGKGLVDDIGKTIVVNGLLTRNAKTGKPIRVDEVSGYELVQVGSSDCHIAAMGCTGWQIGDETAETAIRRIRDNWD